MTTCPKCNSTSIDKLNYGKRAGAVTGRAVDEHILNNYMCLKCEYKFNET